MSENAGKGVMSEEYKHLLESLSEVLNDRIGDVAKAVQSELKEVNGELKRVNEKLERVAVMEEKHNHVQSDLNRSFAMYRDIRKDVDDLKLKMPLLEKGNRWTDRVLDLIVVAVVLSLLYLILPHGH